MIADFMNYIWEDAQISATESSGMKLPDNPNTATERKRVKRANFMEVWDTRLSTKKGSFSVTTDTKTGNNLEIPKNGSQGTAVISGAPLEPEIMSMATLANSWIPETITGIFNNSKILPERGYQDILYMLLWIISGGFFLFISWTMYFVFEYSTTFILIKGGGTSESIVNETLIGTPSPSDIPTAAPTFFDYVYTEGNTRNLIYSWMRLSTQAFLFMPLAFTIIFYVLTDIGKKYKGKLRSKKLIILYLSHIILTIPFTHVQLSNPSDFNILVAGTPLLYLSVTGVWVILAKYLKIQWRMDVRWLPFLQLSQAGTFIIAGVAAVLRESTISDIMTYVPLMLTTFEMFLHWILRQSFMKYQENTTGMTLIMAYLIYPMEATRYACFFVLFGGYKHYDVQLVDLVLNATFSVLGEIYTHTGIAGFCKSWLWKKVLSKPREPFTSGISLYFSSVRSSIEYVVPIFSVTSIYLARLCRFHIPSLSKTNDFIFLIMVNNLIGDIGDVLGWYYLIEIIAEVFCTLVIWLLGSHERVSALGTLSRSKFLTMVVLTGLAVDVPVSTLGFLKANGKL